MLIDGPHFRATDEGELVFLLTDGDSNRRPTEHDILEPEESGTLHRENYYLRVPLDHFDSHRWRDEIAKYLAPLVLGTTMGRIPWTLADFPQGYVLLLHISPKRAGTSKPRRDFYLYGSTEVPSFASPREFVKHAEWLMRGAHRTLDSHRSPRCECKYCYDGGGGNSADPKQSVISRKLRLVRARVLAQINGDEVEDTEDAVIDAEAEAEVKAEADVDVDVDAVKSEAVPAIDHGGHADGNGD